MAQLLANDVQREKTVVLQCFRKFVDTDFLGQVHRQGEASEGEGGEVAAAPGAGAAAAREENNNNKEEQGEEDRKGQPGEKEESDVGGESNGDKKEDTQDYASMLVRELKAELRSRGQEVPRNRKKKELVALLQELDAAKEA